MLKKHRLAVVPLKTKLVCLFVALFIAGVLFGAQTAVGDSALLPRLAEGYTEAQGAGDPSRLFFLSLSADAFVLLLVFLLGFSAVSLPVLVFVPLFKGLGVGAAAGALYLSGDSFFSVLRLSLGFAPTAALSSCVVILGVVCAIRMSLGLFSQLSGRSARDGLSDEAKKFCLKFLLFFIIIVVNAVIDVLLSMLLY